MRSGQRFKGKTIGFLKKDEAEKLRELEISSGHVPCLLKEKRQKNKISHKRQSFPALPFMGKLHKSKCVKL